MARLLPPVCRYCRRESVKLFLKGARCHTAKCAIERENRNKPPGMHAFRRGKTSEYGVRLREKQKVKRYYGLSERQFRVVFDRASRYPGNTGLALLQLLERRLDNVVYKAGLCASRKAARLAVAHGHFHVDGRRLDRPGYLVRPGQKIVVSGREKSQKLVRETLGSETARPLAKGWLDVDIGKLEVRVAALPGRDDVEIPVEEHLIVEFCSR